MNQQRQLKQPFDFEDLEWRVQQSGMSGSGKPWAMVLVYVTNRAVMDRLDETFGIGGWKNEFLPLPNSLGEGALCGISVKINGEWIAKFDGADNTAVESTKGGLSGAMKRAAVQWGIGRYLYDIEEMWAVCSLVKETGWNRAKLKDQTIFYWQPPELPKKFLPQNDITKTQIKTIEDLLSKSGSDVSEYLKYFGVGKIEDLFENEANMMINSLVKKVHNKKDLENGK